MQGHENDYEPLMQKVPHPLQYSNNIVDETVPSSRAVFTLRARVSGRLCLWSLSTDFTHALLSQQQFL